MMITARRPSPNSNQLLEPVSPFQEFTGQKYHFHNKSEEATKLLGNSMAQEAFKRNINKQLSSKEEQRNPCVSLRCSRTLRGLLYVKTPTSSPDLKETPIPHEIVTGHSDATIPTVIHIHKDEEQMDDDTSDDDYSEITMSTSQFEETEDPTFWSKHEHQFVFPPLVNHHEHDATWGITMTTLEDQHCGESTGILKKRNNGDEFNYYWPSDEDEEKSRRHSKPQRVATPTDLLFPHYMENFFESTLPYGTATATATKQKIPGDSWSVPDEKLPAARDDQDETGFRHGESTREATSWWTEPNDFHAARHGGHHESFDDVETMPGSSRVCI
jgi:hypothetical protein